MADPAPRPRMSPAEFLAWERSQTSRHELFAGEVFAIAGGSLRHNALSANAVALLHAGLSGKPCRVLSSDQRIALDDVTFVYADATVVYGTLRLRAGTSDVLENPSIVVEVLSRSTEAYDPGVKWQGYREPSSLEDYLLVAQDQVRVEHFQREAAGSWRYRVFQSGGTINLSNGLTLWVDALFDGIFELAAEGA